MLKWGLLAGSVVVAGALIWLGSCLGGVCQASESPTGNSSAQQENETMNVLETIAAPAFRSELLADTRPVRLLDLRTPEEFATGHLQGATNLDYYAADFQNQLAALDKEAPYYIYCNSGNRSGSALSMMRQLGFANVKDLQGGILAWNSQGYETVIQNTP